MSMTHQQASSPHAESSLQRLYVACRRRARELLTGSAGPWDAEFVRDTAQLLLAAAQRFDFTLGPVFPRRQLAMGRDFAQVFDEFHAGTLRDARYRTALNAAIAVHGENAIEWLSIARIAGVRAYDHALASEAGLRDVLHQLSEQHAAMRMADAAIAAQG